MFQEMSYIKDEPEWMRQFRLKYYDRFDKRPMPNWGGDMSEIFFDDIYYYIKPTNKQVDAWDELPDSVKPTYEKLGIPEEIGRASCRGGEKIEEAGEAIKREKRVKHQQLEVTEQ